MSADAAGTIADFRRRFEQSGGDMTLEAYLRRGSAEGAPTGRRALPDDALADLIAADAQLRRERGRRVQLDDYLSLAPDLTTRTVPLDAAIEAALRDEIERGAGTIEAVDLLSNRHPSLRTLIEEAAVLGRLLPASREEEQGPLLTPGEELGEAMEDGRRRFLVRERLGGGAQGEVHLAVDRRLSGEAGESLVAIKALRRTDDEQTRRRFIEEAARARRVDHPHVVRVVDRGAHEGRDYIVFDYVAGGTLEEHVRSRGGSLPMREAAQIAAQIARGVHAAHAANLVHADLKPGNILMTAQGAPKVADFGVAALVRAEEAPAGSGDLRGNLAFMAPEQFRMEAGGRSPLVDVYALGGLVYWMVRGRAAHGETLGEILDAHETGEAAAKKGDLPEADLDLIVRRALSPAPMDRQPGAGAVAEDLEAWLECKPIGWTRPALSRVARLWARRRPWTAAAIVTLGGGLVASVWTAAHFRGEASQRRSDALASTEAMEVERDWRRSVEKLVTESLAMDALSEQARLDTRVGMDVWLADSFIRRLFVNQEAMETAVSQSWQEYLSSLIGQAEAAGATLQVALLRTLLGSFQLEHADAASAYSTLAQAESTLVSMLSRDDATLKVVQGLRAAAETRLGDAAGARRERLVALEQELLGGLPHFGEAAPGRALLMDALHRLYGPELLDRPASLAGLDARAGR